MAMPKPESSYIGAKRWESFRRLRAGRLHCSRRASPQISIYMLLAVNGTIYFLSAIPFIMLGRGDYNHGMVVSKEREVTKFTALLAVCTFLRECQMC